MSISARVHRKRGKHSKNKIRKNDNIRTNGYRGHNKRSRGHKQKAKHNKKRRKNRRNLKHQQITQEHTMSKKKRRRRKDITNGTGNRDSSRTKGKHGNRRITKIRRYDRIFSYTFLKTKHCSEVVCEL